MIKSKDLDAYQELPIIPQMKFCKDIPIITQVMQMKHLHIHLNRIKQRLFFLENKHVNFRDGSSIREPTRRLYG